MSAHQFILADAFLIVDLILDNVLKILQKANLNV